MSNAFAVLSQLLIEKFGVESSLVREDSSVSELGLDSLTLMEFILRPRMLFTSHTRRQT